MAAALTALIVATTAGPLAEQSPRADAQHLPSDVSLGAVLHPPDGAAVVDDGRPAFARQTPPILRPDHVGNVEFEIVLAVSVQYLLVLYLFIWFVV
jgi:hypothetical protein